MNKQRRKALEAIADKIVDITAELESIMDEEQEAYDNLPENLQYSERGERMSEGIDALQEIYDTLEEQMDNLTEFIEEY